VLALLTRSPSVQWDQDSEVDAFTLLPGRKRKRLAAAAKSHDKGTIGRAEARRQFNR
jgi:hypothetical protein